MCLCGKGHHHGSGVFPRGSWALTPVRDGVEAGGQRVPAGAALLRLARTVQHLHAVAVVEELAARLLAPARVLQRLRARAAVGAPVHQHLGRDHDAG